MKVITNEKSSVSTLNEFMNQDVNANSGIKVSSAVVHPPHYNEGSIECIDALNAMVENWHDPVAAVMAWQAAKYIWRSPFKGDPKQDIEKAIFYLNRLIKQYERSEKD